MSENNQPIESDRRIATVMFADISGFTTMSEKLDPEEVTDIMNECFRFMGECIELHGGTIDKFMGDCVMALFGAPMAHENAPHQAIKTALEMQTRLLRFNEEKRLPIPLSFHIGINTGPVIAGMVGSDNKQDFTVMGDAVNLASRMEGAAKTGDILVAENTFRLTEGYFDFESAGEVKLKGKDKPVKTYKVLGPRRIITRVEASREKGLSPFVGRDMELGHLKIRLEQAKEGLDQAVGITGEPGVGKSRLVCQFRDTLPAEEFTVIEGGCIHFGDAIPYLPILDMLRDYFDISEDEDEKTIKQKIKTKVTRLSEQPDNILSPIHEILSLNVEDEEYIKLDAKQRHDRVFEAFMLLLMAVSQRKPLIIIIEDLHWIDKTSEEFLAHLIGSLASARILLILLFRPEYKPSWAEDKTHYSNVRVDQLPRKTIEDLVTGILGGSHVDPELYEFIANRTDGNPLFIEEMTYNLLETGAVEKNNDRYSLSLKPSNIQVPASIQGIIAARLDRLEGTLKGIIQTASVIGREFAFRILRAIASLREDLKSSLVVLKDLEYIYEKNLFPELEYIFKHALTQEVAYNSMLIKKRRDIHARVGQAIEQIYAGRLEEFYEILAYHYTLSTNTQKAYQYLKLSGDKALRCYANAEAIRYYREAIRILDSWPETEANKREKLEVCLSSYNAMHILAHPEGTLEILTLAERLAQELGETMHLATIYNRLGYYHTMQGNMLLGREYGEKGFNASEKIGALDFMASTADQLCMSYYIPGDCLKVVDIGQRAILQIETHHREKDNFGTWANVYSGLCGWCGSSLGWLGKAEEGRSVFQKGFQNACELNDRFMMGYIEAMRCNLLSWEGNGDDIVDHAQKSIEYCEEAGFDVILGIAWMHLGSGFYYRGEYATALDHAEKGLNIQKIPAFRPWNYFFLALIHLANGNIEQAKAHAEEALKLSREFGAKVIEGVASILLGSIAGKANPAHIDEALQLIQQGLLIFEERKLILFIAFGYLYRGELLAYANRVEEAQENLKKALALYEEIQVGPNSCYLRSTQVALAKLEAHS